MVNGWAGTAFLMASNWTKFSSIVGEAGNVGVETLCIGNIVGEHTFTGANGDQNYVYYCFSKFASTSAKCDPFIMRASEIDTVLDRGQTWYENNQPDSQEACLQYAPTQRVVVRAKWSVAKQAKYVNFCYCGCSMLYLLTASLEPLPTHALSYVADMSILGIRLNEVKIMEACVRDRV
jgi:hypothetical protein